MNLEDETQLMLKKVRILEGKFIRVKTVHGYYIFIASTDHRYNIAYYYGNGKFIVHVSGKMVAEDGSTEDCNLTFIENINFQVNTIDNDQLKQMLLSDDQETRAMAYGIVSLQYASTRYLLPYE